MNNKLVEYINGLSEEVADIPEERKDKLGKIAVTIRKQLKTTNRAKLNFICTHNSRRSQLCQVWVATLAAHLGVQSIETYSGGTEVTAFNPRAVEAIKRAGFDVENPGGDNPRYKVFYDEDKEPLICYSKRLDDPANPEQNAIAVMTCSEADANCPVVPGAAYRISLPYEDPKEADDTARETQAYDERCRQIAAEMHFMLSLLN